MLITTDIHLTARAQDEYRWWIFNTLLENLHDEEPVLILGDITDAKDGHKSALVNRVVSELTRLTREGHEVHILKGNHDYVDRHEPFFMFLDELPKVNWYGDPVLVEIEDFNILFLPHTREPTKDWTGLSYDNWIHDADLICCHQTFNGANAGQHLMSASVGSKYFKSNYKWDGLVLSGDIHVPQKLGQVLYVGSPHPVAFGDSFSPRIVRVDRDANVESIPVDTIRKVSVRIDGADDIKDLGLRKGDQIKVRLSLPRSEFGMWEAHRDAVAELIEATGARVHALELQERVLKKGEKREAPTAEERNRLPPEELLQMYSEHLGLDEEEQQVGQWIVEEVLV